MVSTMAKSKRWLLPIAIIIAGSILFVAIPTTTSIRKRNEISSALASSSAIRLEEFFSGHGEPDTILTAQVLPASESQHVMEALPISVEVGLPGLFKPCYIPHHRVVITSPNHGETTLGVCFTCDEISFPDAPTNHWIIRMPSGWREPLRQLFLRHGVPVRDHYPMDAPPPDEPDA